MRLTDEHIADFLGDLQKVAASYPPEGTNRLTDHPPEAQQAIVAIVIGLRQERILTAPRKR